MTKEERLQMQRQQLTEMKQCEEELHAKGLRYIAGVDEVGRGPLAGPVVAAAVVLPEDFDALGVDDSKKLSEKRREELFDIIKEKAVAYGIGMADHKVIDEINILQATKMAMGKAINNLEQELYKRAVKEMLKEMGASAKEISKADDGMWGIGDSVGLDYILFDAMTIEDIHIPQQSIIKGDSKVLAIAAASIIAKVTRDRMMVEYDREFPGYAFESNKGYGTKAHYEGIKKQGICPIHRKTFLKNIH